MSKLSDALAIREELKRCSDLVQSVTGKPTTLFRPPYGEYNDEVVRISREGKGDECIQWNVDSLDWKEYQRRRYGAALHQSCESGRYRAFP